MNYKVFIYVCHNVKTLTSLAIWGAGRGGGGSFNNQTGSI